MEMIRCVRNHWYEHVHGEQNNQNIENPRPRPLKKGWVISVLLFLMFVVIIILQVVTIAHFNLFPVVCPLTENNNDNNATSQNMFNNLLLTQMSTVINLTQEILSLTNYDNKSCTNNELLQQLLGIMQNSAQQFSNIVTSLSNLESTNAISQGTINDILVAAKQLLSIQNVSLIFSSHLPISCQDIKEKQPDSPSGYYHVNNKLIYCHMGELCNTEGGWTRLGHLDMTDSTVSCPSGFRLYETDGVRACGRPVGGPSCVSVKLPSNGISYSQVCGRVIGYQYASPDAVDTRFISLSDHNNINTYYLDGVSITQGSPRKHIWSLMAGVGDSSYDAGNCPCNSPPGRTQQIQSFVGNDYFCESGNPDYGWTDKLYTADPLWDGKGCGFQEAGCCAAARLPWFHRTLESTTNYIELRECGDETTDYDDVPISFYEIYVK